MHASPFVCVRKSVYVCNQRRGSTCRGGGLKTSLLFRDHVGGEGWEGDVLVASPASQAQHSWSQGCRIGGEGGGVLEGCCLI